jgi:hypothetical protein
MAYNQDRAEENLRNILARIRSVNLGMEKDILDYRKNDTLTDESDELRTMRDIRFYLLRYYKEIDEILTDLDTYK